MPVYLLASPFPRKNFMKTAIRFPIMLAADSETVAIPSHLAGRHSRMWDSLGPTISPIVPPA